MYLFSEEKLQLRYDTLLHYTQPVYSHERSKQSCFKLKSNFKNANTYTGKVTVSTKKRISRAINIMLQSAKTQNIKNPISKKKEIFKINFITLTIGSEEKKITAKEGYYLLLKPFIQWLTKTKGVTTYIWKAELQGNGSLHYHITTTTWIHYQDIRNKWNYLRSKAGLMEGYTSKYGGANPNSTDVHKVYKIRNISAYLHKELTKNIQTIENYINSKLDDIMKECNYEMDEETIITCRKELSNIEGFGKIWDCSTNLKGQKYYTVYFDESIQKLLLAASKKQKLTEFHGEQFTIIKGNKKLSQMILTEQELHKYCTWIDSIRRANTLTFTSSTS